MSTYGALRMRLLQLFPGLSLELLDGWVSDTYTEILDRLPWKRLESEFVIQSPPSYNVGTVAVSQGSNAITGTGTTWTVAMNGLMIRVNQGTEYYQFIFVDATHATLDRAYEGSTASITGSTVASAGTGYVVGDEFWVIGGNGLARATVAAVNGSGGVTAYNWINTGNNYVVANGVSTTGGLGSGLTLNITSVGGSSGLSYRIDQPVFLMPAAMRVIRGVRPLHNKLRPLEPMTPTQLNALAPQRITYGDPRFYSATWDASTSPPQIQLELYPVPGSPDSTGNTLSWVVDGIFDPAALDSTATSATLLPWVRDSAMIEGVRARVLSHQKDYTGAGLANAAFTSLVNTMAIVNAQQRGPRALKIADEYQLRRPDYYVRGPRHRGFTG